MAAQPSLHLVLMKQLYTLKMRLGENLEEHLDRFNAILVGLDHIGEKPTDQHLAVILLCSLTQAYAGLVDKLFSHKRTLTLQDVMDALNSKMTRGIEWQKGPLWRKAGQRWVPEGVKRMKNDCSQKKDKALPAILELPDEVLGLIIANIPFVQKFQLRLVCRQWNATLHDVSFLEKYVQPTIKAFLCFWPSKKGFAACSPEFNMTSWQSWPTSFIVESSWFEYQYKGRNFRQKIFGGADGLLLVESGDYYMRKLYLVNPMTRSCKMLASVSQMGTIMGMVFDEKSNSYKIFGSHYRDVLVEDYHEDMYSNWYETKLHMFDSKLNSWSLIGTWKFNEAFYKTFDLPTFHQGILHFPITTFSNTWQLGARQFRLPTVEIFGFDSGKSWHQLVAPLPRGLFFVHLFEWQGNLMFVGRQPTVDQHDLWSIEVWQLEDKKNVWMESTTMPNDLLHRISPSQFGRHWDTKFFCHSDANYVFLTISHKYFTTNSMIVQPFACDLSTNLW